MEKIVRNKEITRRAVVKREFYLADDGREFDTEAECAAHEELLGQVNALKTESLGRPLDCDLDEDYWGFHWYKVRSGDDMKVLEEYYRTEFGENACRDAVHDGLVCIADPAYREHDEPLVYTMADMIRLVTGFFKEAGYHTEVRKSRKALKPCPMCGKSVATPGQDESASGRTYHAAVCDFQKGGCGCTGGFRKTPEEVEDAWNMRAGSIEENGPSV